MKSLRESLFDSDLATKDLTFSSKWVLDELHSGVGIYYSFFGDNDTKLELKNKMFKSKLLKDKPMVEADLSMWKDFGASFVMDMNFWGDFLKIIKMIEDSPWIPNAGDRYVPTDITNELKKYLFLSGGISFELINIGKDINFIIKKSFGSKDKWISFSARFREK